MRMEAGLIGRLELLEGDDQVVTTESAPGLHVPTEEQARDGRGGELREALEDGLGRTVVNQASEGQDPSIEATPMHLHPRGGLSVRPADNRGGEGVVSSGDGPEARRKSCLQQRCAGALQHGPNAPLRECVGLRPVRSGSLVHHAELLRSHLELLGVVRVEAPVLVLAEEVANGPKCLLRCLVCDGHEVREASEHVDDEHSRALAVEAPGLLPVEDDVVNAYVISECFRAETMIIRTHPASLLRCHLREATDPAVGVLGAMQQHVLRRAGVHLELLVLGLMFFSLIVWLGMTLGLHLVDGREGAREGVDVVIGLVLQDGDEALRFAFGAISVRVDEVGISSTGPVEREVLLQHEPADADGVHRLVQHERVEGGP